MERWGEMGRLRRWRARMEYASEGLAGVVEVGLDDVVDAVYLWGGSDVS